MIHEVKLYKSTAAPRDKDWEFLTEQATTHLCIIRCEFPAYVPGTKRHITIDVTPASTIEELALEYDSYFEDTGN